MRSHVFALVVARYPDLRDRPSIGGLVHRLALVAAHADTASGIPGRWPIERKPGWPHVVPLACRIHHVRSLVDFRSLESERTFQVTLKLLNSSAYTLQIESVTGHTQHDGMGGSQPLDIAWKAGSNRVGPLSEFEVTFDQRVP
jgi:hypothetical protein